MDNEPLLPAERSLALDRDDVQIFLLGYKLEPGKPDPIDCWDLSLDPGGILRVGKPLERV